MKAFLKLVSHFSIFGPIVSASGYGNYNLYTHGYGTTYVGTGMRRVSCDHYISYVSYVSGYQRKTVQCAHEGAGGTRARAGRPIMSGPSHHGFFAMSTLLTASTALGTRRGMRLPSGGISNKLTVVRSGGGPSQAAPVAPPNSLDTTGFSRRYATYRLYMSIYAGRILHPSKGLRAFVRPRMSCRQKCYHPRYIGYSRIYPAKTVHPVAGTSGATVRVKRTMLVRRGYVIGQSNIAYNGYTHRYPARTVLVITGSPGSPSSPRLPIMGRRGYVNYKTYRGLYPSHPFDTVCIRKRRRRQGV